MEEVVYNGELYEVFYKYDSGYWEIQKKDNRFQKVLVHKSEIKKLTED